MKLLSILFGVVSFIGLNTISKSAISQSCTPDASITTPGFYPKELPVVFVGKNYNTSLQVLALKDTNVVFQGFPVNAKIDSIVLKDIIGLPDGFVYACVPSKCSFSYPTVGCVGLEGNATTAQIGDYPLKIAIVVYGKVSGFGVPQQDTLTTFTLYVREEGSAGIRQGDILEEIRIYPNPLDNHVLNISGSFIPTSATIIDASGQKVKHFANNNGLKSLTINDLSTGIYSVVLENERKISIQKLIVPSHIN